MHELALMESVVATVEARVRPARVARVRLQIGQLAGVLTETVVRGKELRLEKVEVQ